MWGMPPPQNLRFASRGGPDVQTTPPAIQICHYGVQMSRPPPSNPYLPVGVPERGDASGCRGAHI
eukprot:787732-Pyramimonas_sp.AAC.2